ncbi:hypothetical protein D3C79_727010 [compost metagenome]
MHHRRAGHGRQLLVGDGQCLLGTALLQAHLGQLHLGAGCLDRRCAAGPDPALHHLQGSLAQAQRLFGQLQTFLSLGCGLERADDFGTQYIALTLQLQRRKLGIASGDVQTCTALATQLEQLADADGGGLRALAGVFHFPAQFRVGQHTGLAPFACGNVDAPARCGKLGVVVAGRLQRRLQGQYALLRQGQRRQD